MTSKPVSSESRQRDVCPFCDSLSILPTYERSQDGNSRYRVVGDNLFVEFFRDDMNMGVSTFKINFCPVCGKAFEHSIAEEEPTRIKIRKKYEDQW